MNAARHAFVAGGTSGINLAIAEWLIRRRPTDARRTYVRVPAVQISLR